MDLELLTKLEDDTKIELRQKMYSMNFIDVTDENEKVISSNYSGMYRPYLKEFLHFCSDYFNNVIIWSAGKKKYVDKLCQFMFPLNNKPLIIYTYDDCIFDEEEDTISKPLDKLYKDKKTKGMLNEKNTFHIDDRDDTYSKNPNNGILIPEFSCNMTTEEIANHKDNNLLKLMAWFSLPEVRKSKDIRELSKDKIFTRSVDFYIKKLDK